MNAIDDLQRWYLSQCNESWEHSYGVKIDTLDNPGWSVSIDLTNTKLESTSFKKVSYGVEEEGKDSGTDWLVCEKKQNQFIGHGGPMKLEEIITVFLSWANASE
jgi:Immunity protein 53